MAPSCLSVKESRPRGGFEVLERFNRDGDDVDSAMGSGCGSDCGSGSGSGDIGCGSVCGTAWESGRAMNGCGTLPWSPVSTDCGRKPSEIPNANRA